MVVQSICICEPHPPMRSLLLLLLLQESYLRLQYICFIFDYNNRRRLHSSPSFLFSSEIETQLWASSLGV